MEVKMNFRNTTTFLAVFFLAAITVNIAAQEQPDTEQPGAEEQADAPLNFLNFQPIPGLNVFGNNFQKTTDIFLFGTIVGYGYNLKGFGSASVGLINSGRVQGFQLSGIFNFAKAGMDGFQTASIFNTARGTVRGAQLAGIYNYASGKFMGLQVSGLLNLVEGDMWGLQLGPINRRGEGGGVGVQVGLLNFSDSGNVIPIGLVNKVKNGMEHFWVYTDDMLFLNAGYRSGSKIFYTHSNFGIGGELMGREGGKLVIKRGGFGFEFPISKFFIDIDISTGNIFKVDEVEDFWSFFFGTNTAIYQLRLIGGYKMYKRLGIFAGISYDYLRQTKDTDPDPEEFTGASLGKSNNGETHKIGFFGGLQF
jgi:hypothetical protein